VQLHHFVISSIHLRAGLPLPLLPSTIPVTVHRLQHPLSVIQAEIACINVDFKAFPVFQWPYWIPGRWEIWSESVFPVANSHSGKVAKARPLIPSGSEMLAKIVVWG
jgi:hypothetical protein